MAVTTCISLRISLTHKHTHTQNMVNQPCYFIALPYRALELQGCSGGGKEAAVNITCLVPNANLRTEGSKENMNKFCSQGISLKPTLGGTL